MLKHCFIIGLAIIFLMSAGCSGSSEKTVKETPVKDKPARASDIGLTVEEYVKEYNAIAESKNSFLQLSVLGQDMEEDGKRKVHYHLGDSVMLMLEADSSTGYVSKIVVGCKPEGYTEKQIIERAGIVYIFAIQAASAEFTEDKAMSIISKLSKNLKHNTVSTEYLKFDSVVFGKIMLLRIQASDG